MAVSVFGWLKKLFKDFFASRSEIPTAIPFAQPVIPTAIPFAQPAQSIPTAQIPSREIFGPGYQGVPTPETFENVPGRAKSVKQGPISKQDVYNFVNNGMILFFQSSNVDSAQYFPQYSKLWVEFKNGAVYSYTGVSQGEAVTLANASSKGKWVWDNLRIRGSKWGHKKPYARIR